MLAMMECNHLGEKAHDTETETKSAIDGLFEVWKLIGLACQVLKLTMLQMELQCMCSKHIQQNS